MENLKTIHIVLIGLALLAIGIFVGTKWNTWFPTSGDRQMGGKAKLCCKANADGTLVQPDDCKTYPCGSGGCADFECPEGSI